VEALEENFIESIFKNVLAKGNGHSAAFYTDR
jgi:hypothetical protein